MGGNRMSNGEAPAVPRPARASALPAAVLPIGISREQVAELIGVSPSKFDQMVADGRMPKPKRIDGRRVWDSRKVIIAFEALDGDGEAAEPWGRMSL
jgi:hypothetical protein